MLFRCHVVIHTWVHTKYDIYAKYMNVWMMCVSGDCAATAFALFVTYGDEHSTRTRSVSRRKSLPNSIYRTIFFLLHCTRTRTHTTISHFPSSLSLSLPSSRSDGTHRSGTMVALYSTAALAEFGLAPAKRYSRCSRHVEFIVADLSINRFRPLFAAVVACEVF